jgi:alpha-ketoglutarate-dependent taurine dioxygenase
MRRRLSSESLVRLRWLDGGDGFCRVIEPATALDPVAWAREARDFVDAELARGGALLFRGFDLRDVLAFRAFIGALDDQLLDYPERAAARTQVAPNVFTSTELAADQAIPLHHEMSYSHHSPGKLWFYCERAAERGGATPLASERAVTPRIPGDIRARLLERGILYVRNYGEGVDLSWQDAFQTDDRAAVAAYCERAGMTLEWRDGDRLRTRARRHVMVAHPRTAELLWFNHAAIFHESNLPPEVRRGLRDQFRADEMPRNVFYGDGTPIDDELLAQIRASYDAAAVRFDWRHGDVVMLDNFLAVHGRDPFVGPRSILVAMAELRVHAGSGAR